MKKIKIINGRTNLDINNKVKLKISNSSGLSINNVFLTNNSDYLVNYLRGNLLKWH